MSFGVYMQVVRIAVYDQMVGFEIIRRWLAFQIIDSASGKELI